MPSPKKPAPKKRVRRSTPRVVAEFHVHLPEDTEAKVERIGHMTHVHVKPPNIALATSLRDLAADNVIDASKALIAFYRANPRPADAAEVGLIDGLRLALEGV